MHSRTVSAFGRRGRLALSLLACLLLASGCTPPPQPAAPERLRVIVEPSTATLFERLAAAYGAQHSYLHIQVSERSADTALRAVVEGEADLALIERGLVAGEELDPETWKPHLRAWPIGRGALAFVVHPSNPVQGLSRAQLQRVFAGLERRWSSLGGEDRTLRLVTREETAPLRELLEREVLLASRLSGSAIVMPKGQAVADYVAANPEAIGYLSASQLELSKPDRSSEACQVSGQGPSAGSEQGVKVLAVDGIQPDMAAVAAGSYPLTYPLVIVTPAAISGKAKGLLDYCLSQEGQAIVASTYAPLP